MTERMAKMLFILALLAMMRFQIGDVGGDAGVFAASTEPQRICKTFPDENGGERTVCRWI